MLLRDGPEAQTHRGAAMRDIEFYAQVLGPVEPWFVEDVELSVENKRIDIFVSHDVKGPKTRNAKF